MKRFALLVLLCLPVLTWAGPEDSAVKVSYIRFAEDDKKVTQIQARFGSGTVVEYKEGYSYVLTCRHCCPDDNGYLTVLAGSKCIQAHFVASDGKVDLALIRCRAQLPTVQVADRPPDSGTEVLQYGYPGGGPQEPKSGAIVGNDRADSEGYIPNHVRITVHPGDSGSGVFIGGKLTGVIYKGTADEDRQNWRPPALSVKLADVQRFLKDPTANPPKIEAPAPKPVAPPPCPPGKP